MQSLREFFTSSSGLVPARQGLALGWVISALTGITVLLGAKEAAAECGGIKSDCPRDAGCARENPSEPFRCCYFEQHADCSLRFLYCECVASA